MPQNVALHLGMRYAMLNIQGNFDIYNIWPIHIQ